MNKIESWKLTLMGAIVIVYLSSCGSASRENPTPEPSSTASPPTSTPIQPTRTPFPASCAPSDPSILEIIDAFVILANDKNVEGTMELFAEYAILDESFKGYHFEGTEQITPFWRLYYSTSPPCDFRDIAACGNIITFIWADLYGDNTTLWPVVIEINDGKITFMDFYEKATIEFPEKE
jgi:hypothetical protein